MLSAPDSKWKWPFLGLNVFFFSVFHLKAFLDLFYSLAGEWTMTVVILICPLKQVKLLIWKGSQDKFISLKKSHTGCIRSADQQKGYLWVNTCKKQSKSLFCPGGVIQYILWFCVHLCLSSWSACFQPWYNLPMDRHIEHWNVVHSKCQIFW